jgi:hypothetical protein
LAYSFSTIIEAIDALASELAGKEEYFWSKGGGARRAARGREASKMGTRKLNGGTIGLERQVWLDNGPVIITDTASVHEFGLSYTIEIGRMTAIGAVWQFL